MGGRLRVWDPPASGHRYVIGIDTAENRVKDIGQTGRKVAYSWADDRPDYSAMCVVDKEHGIHVATWHGYLEPPDFAHCAAALGLYYNTALLVPEVNGPGLVVVDRLIAQVRYPNVYRSRLFNRVEGEPFGNAFGWQTNAVNRELLLAKVRDMVNSGEPFTRDPKLIKELRTLEYDERGVPRARGSNKDDLVFALALALQGRHEELYGTLKPEQDLYKDLPGQDRMVWKHIKRKTRERDLATRNRSPFARMSVRRSRFRL